MRPLGLFVREVAKPERLADKSQEVRLILIL